MYKIKFGDLIKPAIIKDQQRIKYIRFGIILTGSWMMIGLISIVDYMSRGTFDLSLFYLIPLFLITWYVNTATGIISAGVITLVWGCIEWQVDADLLHGSIVVWNSMADFVLYGLFSMGISYYKGLIKKLHVAAESDELTGAANRRCFYRYANREISRSRRFGGLFSIVYFDIDNFKAVNDTLGHNAGDALLCRTVSVLCSHSRNIDMIARLGGDEFAVLLPETGQDAARSYIAKLHSLLRGLADQKGWPVTFSIGVITCTAAPRSVEELISQADGLMYAVKQSGKNNVAFSTWPDEKDGDKTES